jgi:hypothetical protein
VAHDPIWDQRGKGVKEGKGDHGKGERKREKGEGKREGRGEREGKRWVRQEKGEGHTQI